MDSRTINELIELYDTFGPPVAPDPLPSDASAEEQTLRALSAWPHELKQVEFGKSSDGPFPTQADEPACIHDANVVTSKIKRSVKHTIMLDLDVPATLVPSSTPGHSHLYIDTPMDWAKYVRLLDALRDAGVIEYGYAEASKARGYTALRLPWVRKGGNEQT
jgi:hypothetical protein